MSTRHIHRKRKRYMHELRAICDVMFDVYIEVLMCDV